MKKTQTIDTLRQPLEASFNATHMAAVVANLQAARVMLRMVLLAVHAQDNGAVVESDTHGASRWSAVIGAVLVRLDAVQLTLIETPNAPPVDYWTTQALIKALDSALWDGYCTSAPVLSTDELKTAVQVVIDALDDQLCECADVAAAQALPGSQTNESIKH